MQTINRPEPSQSCLEAMSRSFEMMKELDDVVDWDAMSDEAFEQAVADFEHQAGLDSFSPEKQDAAFWGAARCGKLDGALNSFVGGSY